MAGGICCGVDAYPVTKQLKMMYKCLQKDWILCVAAFVILIRGATSDSSRVIDEEICVFEIMNSVYPIRWINKHSSSQVCYQWRNLFKNIIHQILTLNKLTEPPCTRINSFKSSSIQTSDWKDTRRLALTSRNLRLNGQLEFVLRCAQLQHD